MRACCPDRAHVPTACPYSFPPNTPGQGTACPRGHSLLPCSCLSEGGPGTPTGGIRFHVNLSVRGGPGSFQLPLLIPLSFGGSRELEQGS